MPKKKIQKRTWTEQQFWALEEEISKGTPDEIVELCESATHPLSSGPRAELIAGLIGTLADRSSSREVVFVVASALMHASEDLAQAAVAHKEATYESPDDETLRDIRNLQLAAEALSEVPLA